MIPIAAAGLSILGDVGSSLINAGQTARTNRANQQWSEKMYQMQKSDEIQFWGMQNEYNSPQAQMKRLQEAGLNPNLIYGSGGVSGNSSTSPKTPTPQNFTRQTPQFNLGAGEAVNAYFNTEAKQAQTNNLKLMNTNIALQAGQEYIKLLDQQREYQRKSDTGVFSVDMQKINQMNGWLKHMAGISDYQFKLDTFDTRKQALNLKNDWISGQIANTANQIWARNEQTQNMKDRLALDTFSTIQNLDLKRQQLSLDERRVLLQQLQTSGVLAGQAANIAINKGKMAMDKVKLDMQAFDQYMKYMGVTKDSPEYLKQQEIIRRKIADVVSGIDPGAIKNLRPNPAGGSPRRIIKPRVR